MRLAGSRALGAGPKNSANEYQGLKTNRPQGGNKGELRS